jgi:hypothetical protein
MLSALGQTPRRVAARASDVAPVDIDSQLVPSPEFPVIVELEPAALKFTVLRD